MKSILIGMVLVSIFFLRPASAAVICDFTLTNCLPYEIAWCSYSGDSFWETLYAADDSALSSEQTATASCFTDGSCYITSQDNDVAFDCTSSDVDGFVDCNEYACIDTDSTGSITWNSGDTEYCCDGTGNDACQTSCD